MIKWILMVILYLPIFAGMDLALGRLTGSGWGLVGLADIFFGAIFGLAVATQPLLGLGLLVVWMTAALGVCLQNLYRGLVR